MILVSDMLDMKFEYANSLCKDGFKSAFKDAFSNIEKGDCLLKMTVFSNADSGDNYFENLNFIKEQVNNTFKNKTIEVSYVAQKTLKTTVAIELVFASDACAVLYKFYKDISYVTLGIGHEKVLFISGILGDISQSISQQSNSVFQTIEAILRIENMPIYSIVRQWNYIPEITLIENKFQHYQEFNDARAVFYEKSKWDKGYPAATGIGTKNAPLLVDVIAMQGHKDEIALVNSKQIDAHIYSDDVLLGAKGQLLENRATPKFERAKLIIESSGASVFVSGTAAIMGEESLALDNAANQTEITIDHIEKLVEKGQLSTTSFSLKPKFELVRAYVKNMSDFNDVRRVCERRLPGVPVVYVEADICRDELLVEIEAFVKI